jgi:hypothetical protein
MVNCLDRLLDPESDLLLVASNVIDELALEWLRKQGMVPWVNCACKEGSLSNSLKESIFREV